jgi:hypothetical protein
VEAAHQEPIAVSALFAGAGEAEEGDGMIKSRPGAWFIPSVQIALAIRRAVERKK